MARKYSVTCRTCTKFKTEKCPRNNQYDQAGFEKCEEFESRMGRRNLITGQNPKGCNCDECTFWTNELREHPDNCLKGVFDRKEKRKDCIFFERKNTYVPDKCDKKNCVFFAKSARSKDNCNKGQFGNPDCDYTPRENIPDQKNIVIEKSTEKKISNSDFQNIVKFANTHKVKITIEIWPEYNDEKKKPKDHTV